MGENVYLICPAALAKRVHFVRQARLFYFSKQSVGVWTWCAMFLRPGSVFPHNSVVYLNVWYQGYVFKCAFVTFRCSCKCAHIPHQTRVCSFLWGVSLYLDIFCDFSENANVFPDKSAVELAVWCTAFRCHGRVFVETVWFWRPVALAECANLQRHMHVLAFERLFQ